MITKIFRLLGFIAPMAAPLLTGCVSIAVTPDVRQALAPTGKLRVGVYTGSPTSMVRDPVSGEAKGISFDLGKEFASRLGVPFEPVEFGRIAQVLEALKIGAVDFTVTNATAARAKDMDFTAPVLDLELGYLVISGSSVSTIADVDQPGIRIGVTQGSTSQSVLSRQFKHAALVPAPSLKGAIEMLSSRKADAYATNKAVLFEISDRLPGSRVLDGRWGLEHMAVAIPKGRDQGLPYVRKFAEDAKSGGLVKRLASKAGLRGIANTE
jgi:polar amino acid transport system substrate-binding protein